MRAIHAEIEIQAAPERVWEVLTDFGSYGEWNSFMRRVEGRPEAGTKLHITMRRKGGRELDFDARVLVADPPCELAWTGTGLRGHWPGLVRGERRVRLQPLGSGRTLVRMETTFTGLLSGLMRWLDDYEPAFREMEAALKARAEGTEP